MSSDIRPKISVITSIFRGERYLEGYLKALEKQTIFGSMEVVIDHNEPSEAELVLIEDFKRKNPGVIKHLIRENVVPYSASWNRCIREARSDIVAIWSVDDVRTPDSLGSQVELFDEDECDVAFGPYIMVKNYGERDGVIVDDTHVDQRDHLRRFFLGPFFAFKKDICSKAGYLDEQFRSSADLDFAIRLAMHGKISSVDTKLGYYLNERKGLSTRPGTVLPIETTAIQMRYGIYENISFHCIPKAIRYDISQIRSGNDWEPIERYCPNRRGMIKEAYLRSLPLGVRNYLGKTADLEFYRRLIGLIH